MTCRHRSSVIALSLSLWLVAVVSLAAAQDMPRILESKSVFLPQELEEIIAAEYPDYHIPTIRDYRVTFRYHDARRLENALREVNGCRRAVFEAEKYPIPLVDGLPYVCWGDFNGDNLTDVALILLRNHLSHPDSASIRRDQLTIAFHQTDSGYEAIELRSGAKGLHYCQYIRTQESGRIRTAKGKGFAAAPDDIEFVELNHEAIISGEEGKPERLIYWEDRQYKEVMLSD